jgi:hypothetical protein
MLQDKHQINKPRYARVLQGYPKLNRQWLVAEI